MLTVYLIVSIPDRCLLPNCDPLKYIVDSPLIYQYVWVNPSEYKGLINQNDYNNKMNGIFSQLAHTYSIFIYLFHRFR